MKSRFFKIIFCLTIFIFLSSCAQFLEKGYYIIRFDDYDSYSKITYFPNDDKLNKFLEQGELKKANALLKNNVCQIKRNAIIYLPHSLETKKIFNESDFFTKLKSSNLEDFNIIQFSQYISVDEFKTWSHSIEIKILGYEDSRFYKEKQQEFQDKIGLWDNAKNFYMPYLKKRRNKKLTRRKIFKSIFYNLCFIHALKGSNLELAAYLLKKGAIINVKSYYEPGDLSPLSAALSSFDPYKTLLFLKAHGLKKAPLFDSDNDSFLEILNDDGINIEKIISYFSNRYGVKMLRKSYNISKLLGEDRFNIILVLAGRKIFSYKNKKNLFFNLIDSQENYKYINQNQDCKRKMFDEREKCRSELAENIDKKYVKYRKLIKYFFDELKVNPNIRFASGKNTPLIIAAKQNNLKTLKLLLDFKAKVNAKNKAGKTALYWAIKNNNPKMLHALLKNIKKYHFNFLERKQILHCFKSIYKFENLLLTLINSRSFRAYIDMKNSKGQTLLMQTSSRHYEKIVKALIKNKANLNLKDKNGKTALIYALEAESKIFNILLEAGANIKIKDKNKNNLILLFCLNKSSYDYYSRERSKRILLPLIDQLNVNERNKNFDTALLILIKTRKKHWKRYAELLITKGKANVNLKDKEGNYPIFLALNIYNQIRSLLDLFFKSDTFDVNVKNKAGRTVLILLAKADTPYIEPYIKELIKRKVKLNTKDIYGKTALDYLNENNVYKRHAPYAKYLKNIIKLLKKHGAKRAAEL